jgi:Fe(3+) dicitrate transport protein
MIARRLTGLAALTLPLMTFPTSAIAQDVAPPAAADPVQLAAAVDAETIILILGTKDRLAKIPGSSAEITTEKLELARPFSLNEALRQVPGVIVRDEEGIGLRPNIGVRGLNPTRSTEVLLLEDGIPVSFAPYGDNASYYHPPIDRFDRVEILKGAGQIAFGPHTVGAVVNYLTPSPTEDFSGKLGAAFGNRDFYDLKARASGTAGAVGLVFDATLKEADGARENMHSRLLDVNGKAVIAVSEAQSLTLRGNFYDENNQLPYSGLTLAEFTANPRFNPFVNDDFDVQRFGVSATHALDASDQLKLLTTIFYTNVDRRWWRQSSNSLQRPNDSSDPRCAGIANLLTTCGNEGRLRKYSVFGIEPRGRYTFSFGEVDFGVRFQTERQRRLQANGDTPNARTAGTSVNAGIRENNNRSVDAWSGFVQPRFDLGDVSVTPGVRVEHIKYTRTNLLNNTTGKAQTTAVIPGVGMSWTESDNLTLFAGVHRGFSPPGVADIIDSNGGSFDLDAETSWNWEAGLRAKPLPGVSANITYFRLDFSNQVIASSLAGGVTSNPSAPLNAGKTLHQGLETGIDINGRDIWETDSLNPFVRLAHTWVPTAKFRSNRFLRPVDQVTGATLSTAPLVNVRGNRLPYAPKHAFTVAAGVGWTQGHSVQAEYVYVSSQFGDDLNTRPIVTSAQRGRIPGYGIMNLTANVVLANGVTLYATAKNVLDKTYIVDLSRGIFTAQPALFQGGVSWKF